MNRRVQRQPHADKARLRRIAEAQPGHRKHLVGQLEDFRDFGDAITEHADRAAAEPERFGCQRAGLQGEGGIDRGVEEPFERAVGLAMAAQFAEFFEPPRVADKDQGYRRGADPRHVREQRRQPIAPDAVLQPDHRGLLKIGFRGGRERRREQQPHQ